MEKRGEVHIGPNFHVPEGSMMNPALPLFGGSWQDDEGEIDEVLDVDAESAVAWGRERSDYVLVLLDGHGYGVFSAGVTHLEDPDDGPLPLWPREGPPLGGWWESSGDQDDRIWG